MKKLLLAAFALSCFSGSAMATVTFFYELAWTPGGVAVGSTGIMVVDTAGDGFNSTNASLLGESLAVGTTLGADDYIIDSTTAVDFGGGLTGFTSSVSTFTLGTGGVGAGDDMRIYWFDSPLLGDPLVSGQTYGSFRTDTIDGPSNGNLGFEIPGDGNSNNIFAYSTSVVGGVLSDASFIANNDTIIPEPGTGVLLGGAAFLMFLRRRRR